MSEAMTGRRAAAGCAHVHVTLEASAVCAPAGIAMDVLTANVADANFSTAETAAHMRVRLQAVHGGRDAATSTGDVAQV